MRRLAPLLIAVAAVGVVIGTYLALGGASYEPTRVADPCEQQAQGEPDGLEEAIERIALVGLADAACELGVTREELVLALRDESALDSFAASNGLDRTELEEAVRDGVVAAIDQAEDEGAIPGLAATLARGTIARVPPWLLIEAVERIGELLT